MSDIVQERARPFFFPGGPNGCLLIHGFTGSPTEMRWLGEHLADQGFSVLGVRLSAHGTDIKDMRRVRWRDWVASVEDGWQLLGGAAEKIVLIGLSMGGALAALLAEKRPASGIVMMSTPYALPRDRRLPLARPLSVLWPYVGKGHDRERDPEIYDYHFSYDRHPTLAIAELNDLLRMLRAALPNLSLPALVMHSKEDAYVPPANAASVFNALGSSRKELLWVERGGHVITLEPDRMSVYRRVAEFVKEACETRPG